MDKLISAALGLTRVKPDLNPLRPDVFAKCLLNLLYGVAAPTAVTALWIKHLGVPLGQELSRVYERVINLLELSGVRAVGFRVQAAPTNLPVLQHGQAAPSNWAGAGSSNGWRHQNMLQSTPQFDPTADSGSFQNFLVREAGQADQPLSPEFRARMRQELAALTTVLNSVPSEYLLLSDPVAHTRYADVAAELAGRQSAYQRLPTADRPPRAARHH